MYIYAVRRADPSSSCRTIFQPQNPQSILSFAGCFFLVLKGGVIYRDKRFGAVSLQMEGGQVGAEKFVRMLYNGRVVKPNFCQRDECPLRTYRSHVMQFLVPEDLEVSIGDPTH